MTRRWREWTIPYDIALRALTGKDCPRGSWIVSADVPSDLMIVSFRDAQSATEVDVIVASDTFDHIEEGDPIPDWRPKLIQRTEPTC